MKSRWEWFWLISVGGSLGVVILLPLHPKAEWPRWALYTGGAAVWGIVSILAFYWAWYRARSRGN